MTDTIPPSTSSSAKLLATIEALEQIASSATQLNQRDLEILARIAVAANQLGQKSIRPPQTLDAAPPQIERLFLDEPSLRTEILARISHDLRTPMNAVLGLTHELLDSCLGNDEQRDTLRRLEQNASALLRTLERTLDLTQLGSSPAANERSLVDVPRVLGEALDVLAPDADEKGLELVLLVQPEVPRALHLDPITLRQILLEIVGNAIQYTSHGEVVLTASARERDAARTELYLAVRDTGPGIEAERLARLLDPQLRSTPSFSRRFRRNGLGIAIASGLARRHGGSLTGESRVGAGSTFHIQLQAERGNLPDTRFDSPGQSLVGKHLLIIDDNRTVRRMLTMHTRQLGLEPRAAVSLDQALDWIRQGARFDLVILDGQLEPNCISRWREELGRMQHQRPPHSPVTIVAASAPTDLDEPRTTYLTKPIKAHELDSLLADLLIEPKPTERASTQPAPRPKANAKTSPTIDSALPSRASAPLTILLAEDNKVNQKLALKVLEKLGYSADVAADGSQALAALEAQRYDVVLMDMQMPVMDGAEATRQICLRWEPSVRPQIIALTANALEGDREACLDLGMVDYLTKPFKPEQLRSALARCVRRLRARRSDAQ